MDSLMALAEELSPITGTFQANGGSLKGFLDAVTVWINKPHVVNRRLCGTKIIHIKNELSFDAVKEEINRVLPIQDAGSDQKPYEGTNTLQVNLKELRDENFVIIIREMLPKQIKTFPSLLEAVVYDSAKHSITFYPLFYTKQPVQGDLPESKNASAEVTYCFTFEQQDDLNSSVQLSCNIRPDQNIQPSSHIQTSIQWLKDTLLPKIAHWTEQSNLTTAIKSLRLVDLDQYNKLYATLKEKYGSELVKNWTETTNPEKFVYEDIGIATYLLLIWEQDRHRMGSSKKQSFVDLGCGNGLLVYILSKEGHPGLGIDLRKRNIWGKYGSNIRLEERPITPSADNLFPEFDWIIGNHSDELTPWIPVITARSSYTCSYFVLPCCPHDFTCRFSGKVKGESHFQSYLSYVSKVGQACGFEVEKDTLRIPSTKRVCQIGRHRTYPVDQEAAADKRRQEFINKRCASKSNAADSAVDPKRHTQIDSSDSQTLSGQGNHAVKRTLTDDSLNSDQQVDSEMSENSGVGQSGTGGAGVWVESFQARSNKELVRNCQKVCQETKDRVVRAVFDAVLTADDATEVEGQNGKRWRKGGSIELGAVALMLDTATREELKSECGGVQTLLRNHHSIFQVSGGKVQLRDFSVDNPWSQHKAAKTRKKDPAAVLKTSLCWFYHNHPDGCPRTNANCSFAHSEAELRPRENPKKK